MSTDKNGRKGPMTLRKPLFSASAGALTLGLPSLLLSSALLAEEEAPILLDTMQIEERTIDTNPYAEPGAPYKAKVSGDSRHVKELADTPQTITVLTQTEIKDSGVTDLKDILAAQPGITLGTGENGNAFGDRYVIRGYEARSDVFVDGLRDTGMTTRESFAVDQIEITKGPSSTFAGRGSTGGAVNAITKQARTEYDFTKLEGGLGTDNYRRATVDSNLRINDDIAVRANLLHSYQEVPDREPADRERNGAALSAVWQASDKLKIIGDYYHLSAFDQADLGSYIDRTTGEPYKYMPSYSQDEDFVKSRVDTFTLRVSYAFSDNLRIENAMRHGTTNNGYVVTGASGATRDATDPAGAIPTIRLSTHQGWQEVEYFADQLNLFFTTELAGMKHQFVFGSEYSKHDVLNGVYNVTNNGATNCTLPGRGSNPPSDGYCILDENGDTVDDINSLMDRDISKGNADSDYQIDTVSLYVMDTVDITDDFSVFAGLRADMFDYSNVVTSGGTSTRYAYDDTLWNGHIGTVYQLTEDGNVYLTYSTSANINGGESDVGGNCGYGGLCSSAENVSKAEPEDVENIELGTKWNLFDDKLLATAAVFRITKDNVMEGTDYDTDGTYNTGKNRVQGFEVSLSGNLTERLSTQFGFALMESEILKSNDPDSVGGRLANFADRSANLQLRYQLTDKLNFGGTMTHASEVYVGQPDSPAGTLHVPAYIKFDAFAGYDFTEQLSARLNVINVSDKDYYLTAYRSGSFAYIGDARSAHVTVSYEF